MLTPARKYIGYKDFASQVAADPDFFVARRFDRLHVRVILTLQAQIVELEEKLDALDNITSATSTKLRTVGVEVPEIVDLRSQENLPDLESQDLEDINNGSVRCDLIERAGLINTIAGRLAEYSRSPLLLTLLSWLMMAQPCSRERITGLPLYATTGTSTHEKYCERKKLVEQPCGCYCGRGSMFHRSPERASCVFANEVATTALVRKSFCTMPRAIQAVASADDTTKRPC